MDLMALSMFRDICTLRLPPLLLPSPRRQVKTETCGNELVAALAHPDGDWRVCWKPLAPWR
jgi:hypothetical protein